MKILIIGQLPKEAGGNYTTGAAKVVYELSKQSVKGVEHFTFATNISDTNAKRSSDYPNQYIGYIIDMWGLLKDLLCHPIRTSKEWLHFMQIDHQNPLRYAFYKTNIRRAIKMIQPDLIHVNSIGNVSVTRFALEGKQIPVLLTCHGIFYRGDKSDVKGRDVYMGNLPLCDYFTGLTEESRHEFTDFLGVPDTKFTIIPNGVDTSKFYYSNEWRSKIRDAMRVSDDTIVFITVASLQDRKGQLAFIKVLEQFNLEYQYWLVGLGHGKKNLENYVTAHRLEKRVKFLGYKNSDELYKYYSAADVYAHVSWKEGQALSEIEAYSTGLRTLVNTAIKGTLIENPYSDCYCLVNLASPDYDAIKMWIKSGKGAERSSKQKYDWENIMGRYVTLYKEVLNNNL